MSSRVNPKQLSIRRLLNTSFDQLYQKLFLGAELSPKESVKILSIATILSNQNDIELKRLGYRIVLLYGNLTEDYIPLYDLAINTGLIPVANLIKNFLIEHEKKLIRSVFVEEFTESFVDSFRESNIVYTEQQLVLNTIFQTNIEKSMYVVAPTSYGKSELITQSIKFKPGHKFCVVVPSKSLLMQTKKRVLDENIDWIQKIITHPDMHDENTQNAVYILTQERLSRLLNIDKNLSFDFLFIDEAHNLLDKDYRNQLLASVISIVNHRNPTVAIKYLTPFLKDVSNLEIKTADKIDLNYSIKEYVKSEKFYLADYRQGKKENKLYEQFSNKFYSYDTYSENYIQYITEQSTDKNIIYFNRPKDIESFVLKLIDSLEPIADPDVAIAVVELRENFSEEYTLIECLKKGVVYHHGSMTDPVRNYVEYLFRKSPNLKYMVSSSTLLEGINMPIQKLFLMSCKKGLGNLSASQFKNLIGRVSRFSEIFSGNKKINLKKLEPEIHIIGSDQYTSANSNLRKFLKDRVYISKKIKDSPKNILLEKTKLDESNIDRFEDAIFRLENFEEGIIPNYSQDYITTDVGRLLIVNGVGEIDVFANEQAIAETLKEIDDESISDPYELMKVIYNGFIKYSDDSLSNKNNLERLKDPLAQKFYGMMFSLRIEKTPFKVLIKKFTNHWNRIYEEKPDSLVYVGKWGDEKTEDGHREIYTRINLKSNKEKINLAIVRIKEEEDFIDHFLFRFIDILNDLNFIDKDFFKKIKYGTTDEKIISLIRHGLSRGVSELILKKYSEYVVIDIENRLVTLSPKLLQAMRDEDESILQLFEVEMSTGIQ